MVAMRGVTISRWVHVHRAGQHQQAGGVVHLVAGPGGRLGAMATTRPPSGAGRRDVVARGDEATVADQRGHARRSLAARCRAEG